MPIKDIVVRGYGAWETDTHFIPTRGYSLGASAPPATLVVTARRGSGDTTSRSASGDTAQRRGSGDTTKGSGGIG